MDTVATHAHQFADTDWPFSDPTNAAAFSTRQVFREGLPILQVSHDHDGDWQMLCGTTTDTQDLMLVCLGCVFQNDRSVGELARMPRGWHAWRDDAAAPWQLEELDPEDDEGE